MSAGATESRRSDTAAYDSAVKRPKAAVGPTDEPTRWEALGESRADHAEPTGDYIIDIHGGGS